MNNSKSYISKFSKKKNLEFIYFVITYFYFENIVRLLIKIHYNLFLC